MHFISPFRATVAGPSMSGKTEFVKKLLINKDYVMSGEPIERIVWCCKNKNFVPQDLPRLIKKFSVFEGVPDASQIKSNSLVILDDLMMESTGKEVCELFTVNSHHRSISVILITQNFFHKGKLSRDISLCNNYLVFLKNPRDKNQFYHLARQLYTENPKALNSIYLDATSDPYSSLLIDLTQLQPDILRYKTDIFAQGYFACFANPQNVEKQTKEITAGSKKLGFAARAFTV